MKAGSEKMKNNTTFIPNIFETSRYVFYWYYTVIVEQKKANLYGFYLRQEDKDNYKFDVGEDRKIKRRDDLTGTRF